MRVGDLRPWVGVKFDRVDIALSASEMAAWAISVGETESRFCDPDHEDFQATANYMAKYQGVKVVPDDFPLRTPGGFDAGKTVTNHQPVRPGQTVTGHSQLADIYEKTGRSGPMVFLVHRIEFFNSKETLLTVVDWRFVMQPRPDEWQTQRSIA